MPPQAHRSAERNEVGQFRFCSEDGWRQEAAATASAWWHYRSVEQLLNYVLPACPCIYKSWLAAWWSAERDLRPLQLLDLAVIGAADCEHELTRRHVVPWPRFEAREPIAAAAPDDA